jgi:glutamyl-tRNA reductase
MIITSTASPEPILKKDMVGAALKQRRNKPIFMVDIAVPRDIEPSVGDFSDTYLYTVDDLQEIIEENKRSRKDAALEAEEIVELQAESFMMQYQATQQVSPIIQSYRNHAHGMKDQVLSEALHHLEHGGDPKELMTKLANQLTNKILHTPTSNLHQAGLNGQKEVVDAAAQILLFEQSDDSNSGSRA